MDKYFYDIARLAEYLQEQSEDVRHVWVKNFLFKGYTAPLVGISPEQYRSSIIEKLYLLSNDNGKFKLRNTIKEIYKMTPFKDFNIEFYESIALLNITDLIPDLFRLAHNGSLKNVKSENIPEYIDLHTIILKTLFGLTYEPNEMIDLEKIAKRDITDTKYMLECFNFLMSSLNYRNKCVEYIPELLMQTKNKERDYKENILKYLKIFGEDEVLSRIKNITELLKNKSRWLIKELSDILFNDKIIFSEQIIEHSISEQINEHSIEPETIITLNICNEEKKIPEDIYDNIILVFRYQSDRSTKRVLENVREGKAAEKLLQELKTV